MSSEIDEFPERAVALKLFLKSKASTRVHISVNAVFGVVSVFADFERSIIQEGAPGLAGAYRGAAAQPSSISLHYAASP